MGRSLEWRRGWWGTGGHARPGEGRPRQPSGPGPGMAPEAPICLSAGPVGRPNPGVRPVGRGPRVRWQRVLTGRWRGPGECPPPASSRLTLESLWSRDTEAPVLSDPHSTLDLGQHQLSSLFPKSPAQQVPRPLRAARADSARTHCTYTGSSGGQRAPSSGPSARTRPGRLGGEGRAGVPAWSEITWQGPFVHAGTCPFLLCWLLWALGGCPAPSSSQAETRQGAPCPSAIPPPGIPCSWVEGQQPGPEAGLSWSGTTDTPCLWEGTGDLGSALSLGPRERHTSASCGQDLQSKGFCGPEPAPKGQDPQSPVTSTTGPSVPTCPDCIAWTPLAWRGQT